MPDFVVGLAGVPVAVSVRFDSTLRLCADYLTDAEPVDCVVVTPADVEAERIHAEAYDRRLDLARCDTRTPPSRSQRSTALRYRSDEMRHVVERAAGRKTLLDESS